MDKTDKKAREIARACLEGAENDSMAFPDVVMTLMEAGIEGYSIDFRRATATYYLPDHSGFELETIRVAAPIAPRLDAAQLQTAIREAQQSVPGYSYQGFCEKAALAGCAFYTVSFPGKRALYVGRDAATHTEMFPD